ncbi:putative carboxylesterase [Rosa chinensis]|uniref:Putative carboxylesterase n=1 Tax=Rosa chinensis TaxID=74649 RepID=A0A2P6QUK5_ROSCH|nr:putative carboxylesterase [Rosa chinensis]
MHASLFIFGDSIFDAGNNNYINTSLRANFQPYGETFFKYPTGRFSDGPLITDFIGAGALVETSHGLVIDFNSQLSYFEQVGESLRKNLGDEEAKTLISKAVYLFSVGGPEAMITRTYS